MIQAKTINGELAYLSDNGIPFVKIDKKYICIEYINFIGTQQCDLKFSSFEKLVNHKHRESESE